jgi:hypothetical protein
MSIMPAMTSMTTFAALTEARVTVTDGKFDICHGWPILGSALK